MKLEDIDFEVVNGNIVEHFIDNNIKYQGFVIDGREEEQLFFDNQKLSTGVYIMPVNPSGETEVLVKDEESGFVFDVLNVNQKEIQEALNKSEDQKTFEKRMQKIILSTYQRDIDRSIENVEARRQEKEEKKKQSEEKKWYVVVINKGDKPVVLGLNKKDSDEFEYEELIEGPFETEEQADLALNTKYKKEEQFNNPNYIYYIVSKDRILSGWEYKEDARDALKELPPIKRSESRIVSKRDMPIDPDLSVNWKDTDINESEILKNARELFENDAKKKFHGVTSVDKTDESKSIGSEVVLNYYLKQLSSKMSDAISMGLDDTYNDLSTQHNHAFEVLLEVKKQRREDLKKEM